MDDIRANIGRAFTVSWKNSDDNDKTHVLTKAELTAKAMKIAVWVQGDIDGKGGGNCPVVIADDGTCSARIVPQKVGSFPLHIEVNNWFGTFRREATIIVDAAVATTTTLSPATTTTQDDPNLPSNEKGFGHPYQNNAGKVVVSNGPISYVDYKNKLSKTLRASSDSGRGTAIVGDHPLTKDDLLKAFPKLAADLKQYLADKDAGKVAPDQLPVDDAVDAMVVNLNDAFRIMRIDTEEAQAAYMANAFVESVQFRFMTETQQFKPGNRPYETDPARVKPLVSWLNEARDNGKVKNPDGTFTQVVGYNKGGEVNPYDDGWEKSFIGRGPIQVTNRNNYLQTLAVLERRAEELKTSAPADAQKLWAAIRAIKDAPLQAANPTYAFLFSAAMMKTPNGKSSGDEAASGGDLFSWMGQQLRPAEKQAAFSSIKPIIHARATGAS